jgi:rubrerythrin
VEEIYSGRGDENVREEKMKEEKERLTAALKRALEFERQGSEFYIKLGIETRQVLAKRLFYDLAKQEIDHIVKIEEIFDAVRRNVVWPEIPAMDLDAIEEGTKRVFERLDKLAREEELDNLKGYRLAMEFEKKGYEMYRELSAQAEQEEEKKFFEALVGEEKKHLEALDNVHRFLTDTEDWLTLEEGKVWNWMVT